MTKVTAAVVAIPTAAVTVDNNGGSGNFSDGKNSKAKATAEATLK